MMNMVDCVCRGCVEDKGGQSLGSEHRERRQRLRTPAYRAR